MLGNILRSGKGRRSGCQRSFWEKFKYVDRQ